MPTPIVHTAAAFAIHGPPRRQRLSSLLAYAVLGNLPDLDFIPGLLVGDPTRFHHGLSHSLGFALASALLVFAWLRRRPWRLLLCSLSHPMLDLCTVDRFGLYARHWGMPALWPLSDRPLWPILPVFTSPNVACRWDALFSWQNAVVLLTDAVAACFLIIAVGWRWRQLSNLGEKPQR